MLLSLSAQRNLVLLVLLGAAAACWAALLVHVRNADPNMAMAMAGPTMGLPAPAFLALWSLMMVAMMFPTAAPMVLTFQRIEAAKRARGEAFVSTWLFVAGYAVIWGAAGLAAYAAALGAEAIGARAGISAESAARVGGALLLLAGLYQLTPLKHACLAKCRSPIGFVMTAWRNGAAGALRMGLMHGGLCLGCCWLLMAILFPLGIMNIAAMALVMLVVFAEKALPWRRTAVYGAAVALVVYGGAILAAPRLLPTFAPPAPAMTTPGMAGSGSTMPRVMMPTTAGPMRPAGH